MVYKLVRSIVHMRGKMLELQLAQCKSRRRSSSSVTVTATRATLYSGRPARRIRRCRCKQVDTSTMLVVSVDGCEMNCLHCVHSKGYQAHFEYNDGCEFIEIKAVQCQRVRVRRVRDLPRTRCRVAQTWTTMNRVTQLVAVQRQSARAEVMNDTRNTSPTASRHHRHMFTCSSATMCPASNEQRRR